MEDTALNDGDRSDSESESVFSLIHELHSTITKSIDTSLSWDQLNSPPVNYTVIRPIIERLKPTHSSGRTEKSRKKGGGGMLQVPSNQRSEEDGNGHKIKSKKQSDTEGRDGGEGERMGLGMVLYALMANR